MRDLPELKELVEQLALPLIEAQGLVLWGIDIVDGPVLKVCIYVDTPDGKIDNGSATIDNCEIISRQLGMAMEVEDVIEHAWVLEVSSPGLERKFFNLEQMRPYVGDLVKCRLAQPLGDAGRKIWRGKLLAVNEDSFELEPCSVSAEGEIIPENSPAVELPWRDVARARREHIFVMPQKPGKKSGKKREK